MKKRILAGVCAAALALSLAGCGGEETVETAPIGTAVETATVERGEMATENTLSGQVVADKAVYVVPMAQGTVSGLSIQVGDTVTKGQRLFQIDTSTVTASYGALSSTYAATKEASEQGLKNAEIALETAQTNLYNTQQLYAIGAASQFELTQAEDAVKQAENSIAQAKASMQASLAQIQSSMASIGAQAANGNVTAPCDGLVTAVSVVNGGMGGGSAAVTIAEGGRTRVSVSVSESIYGQLKVGDTASVSVPSVSSEPYTGMIASIDVAANPQTALYEVRLYTPAGTEYPIGSFADVTFYSDKREDVVRIPTESILNDEETRYVFVVNDDKATARRVEVQTGLVGTEMTEITSGLTGGETLVVKGQSYLDDGSAIRIVSEG